MNEDKFGGNPEAGAEWLFLVRNWRIAAAALGVALAGAAAVAALVRPVYESVITLSLTQVAATGSLPGETAPGDASVLQTRIQRQRALIASPEFAARLLERLGPAARADLAGGPTGPWWERAAWHLGVQGSSQTRGRPEEPLSARLSVRTEPRSPTIEVRFVAFDPVVAAAVANTAVDLYIQENADNNREAIETYRAALTQQLEESEARLGAQLSTVQALENQKRLEVLQTRKSILERQLEFLENEAAAGSSRDRSVGSSVNAVPAPLSPAAVRLTDLESKQRTLLLTLGEKHPDVISLGQQIEEARAKVAAEAEGKRDAAGGDGRSRPRGAEARMAAERIRQELSRLELELLGFTLERQKLEAGAASMKTLIERQAVASPKIMEAQIVDRARPASAPSYPRPLSTLGYGLLAGLVAGVALSWVVDRANVTIHTPEELKEALHLPFLGVVPVVKDLADGSLMAAIQNPTSGLADSLAVLRANLTFGPAADTARVLLITGPGPGDGKSTVAAGLALAFARTGARVLLIDADLRRPSVHGILGMPPRPGLSEMLSAEWTVKPPVRPSSTPGLDVLVAGTPLRYSAEHLGSDEMRSFIERMRGQYDRTIINSPPVLGLSDALILGTLTDGTVLVCAAGHTPLPAARNAVEMLAGLRTPILGFVLNRSERRRNQYYGGTYYTGPERRGARRGPEARGSGTGSPTGR